MYNVLYFSSVNVPIAQKAARGLNSVGFLHFPYSVCETMG